MRIVQADAVISIVILLSEFFRIPDVGAPPHGRTDHVIGSPHMVELRPFPVIRIRILRDIHKILTLDPEIIGHIKLLCKIAVEKEIPTLAPEKTLVGEEQVGVKIRRCKIDELAFICPAELELEGTEVQGMHIRLFLKIMSKIPENGVSGLKTKIMRNLHAGHIQKVSIRLSDI